MNEEWRPLPSGEYEVSDLGRVRRAIDGYRTKAGRIMAFHVGRNGYLRVLLRIGRRKYQYHSVHRLVAEAFIGPIPDGWQINHLNGCKTVNIPSNLEIVTSSQNVQHSYDTGLKHGQKGSRHGMARLTEAQVQVIAERIVNGDRLTDIAADYGVVNGTIERIAKGKSWTHLALNIPYRDRRAGRVCHR